MDTRVELQPVEPELAPPGTPLHIAVAPGLLGRDHSVIREPDETDESYRSRCELLTVLISYARNS